MARKVYLLLLVLSLSISSGTSCALLTSESEDNSGFIIALAALSILSPNKNPLDNEPITTTLPGPIWDWIPGESVWYKTQPQPARTNGGGSFAHSPANWIAVSDPGCEVIGRGWFLPVVAPSAEPLLECVIPALLLQAEKYWIQPW